MATLEMGEVGLEVRLSNEMCVRQVEAKDGLDGRRHGMKVGQADLGGKIDAVREEWSR